ncbi:MAG: hypothetical protein A2161_12940 [Candidatus Schekmanbacteria bacterium RBG_13_48_7]|uniref:Radical SAM core domain-containing protein n=1 Tax=Candidatus Schekmanbacteria bacterium RBG_13_48_7 TaxID=1817878 RepID=A0A1F7RUV3_9BACT|nr:MAG: hypothetical protein A2161_12940 [Candidatus Schekmanbacteria bacterium RBG_13_48_7]
MKTQLADLFERKLSRETGTIRKDFGGRVSVALIYPNYYYLGMSNLGFLSIYQSINKRNDALCERGFLPDPGEETELVQTGSNYCTLESRTPISRFNIIGFSVSFEIDYLNVLKILRMAKIAPLAKDRYQFFPLLIMGGICASYNPEPLADVFDVIFPGDGFRSINLFIDKIINSNETGSKEDFINQFSELPGYYIPAQFEPVYEKNASLTQVKPAPTFRKSPEHEWISNLDDFPCMSELLTPDTEFGDMILIEISRGCPRNCSFCVISECYGKFRFRSVEAIINQIDRGLNFRKKFGLIGANIADHPKLQELIDAIHGKGGQIAFPSLRLDLLKPDILKRISEEMQITITLAPEAGSERLRQLINKPISQQQIENIIINLMHSRFRKIKLYFMIGLPTEEKQDIEDIISMVKRIKHNIASIHKRKPHSAPIVLSINCFVPKPFTPFQWAPMESVKKLKEKINFIKKSFKKELFVDVIHDVPKWALIQGLLARGDRKVLFLLQSVIDHGNDWNKGIAHTNVNTAFYTQRNRNHDEVFSWDHLMSEEMKQRLWRKYDPVYQQLEMK